MTNKPNNQTRAEAVELLPCPFCGGEADPTGWLRGDGVRGPECNDCGATAASAEAWNTRAQPANQQGDDTPADADGYPDDPPGTFYGSEDQQGEPEIEPDSECIEDDGCPTEGAVLKRFWRSHQPDSVLCKFYEVEGYPDLVRELVGHVSQLQESAKRNVKPWEDTFPPTLLPAYIDRVNAENSSFQPATAKVVLPERMKTRPYQTVYRGSQTYASAWNACLDEVVRLNR